MTRSEESGITHGWNRQQVGLEWVKADAPQDERDICCRGVLWNEADQAKNVQRPKIVVLQRVPQPLRRNRLSFRALAG